MKVHFIHPRTIEGKHYSKGDHELPDSLKSHWFFKGLILAKDVSVYDKSMHSEVAIQKPVEKTEEVEEVKADSLPTWSDEDELEEKEIQEKSPKHQVKKQKRKAS